MMKKLFTLLLAAVMLLSVSVPAWAADGMTVAAKTVAVSIDGKEADLTAFVINGETVLRLRDVALIASGTDCQFDVTWDGKAEAVKLLSGKAYTVAGGELGGVPAGNKEYTVNTSPVYLDGGRIDLALYTVEGTNYVCLTELAALMDMHFATLPDGCIVYTKAEQQLTLSDMDYSDKSHWAAYENKGMDVDIFFLYPTVAFFDANGNPYNYDYVPIDEPGMLKSVKAWLDRAECATTEGNVYAPLYRQLYFGKLATIAPDDFESYTLATPREDVFAAFDYFLTNINKNERPFILVGHSQGASLLAECATLMLGNEKYTAYNKNHIATYAIGYSVTQEQISRNPELKFASSPTDTGVILSWNTTSPSEVASQAYKNFGTWNPDALVINPITWTTDETPAPASANLASKMFNIPEGTFKVFEHYADATVDNTAKVLVCASVDETEYEPTMTTVGRYHTDDMGLYYESIRQNIKDRIEAFLSK